MDAGVVWVIGVITTAPQAPLARAWAAYIKPWLEQKALTGAALIAANAVEASLGRYGGEEKWLLALGKMQERDLDVDSKTVVDALKAACEQMNFSQNAAGMKEPDTEKEDHRTQMKSQTEVEENGSPIKTTTLYTYGEPTTTD